MDLNSLFLFPKYISDIIDILWTEWQHDYEKYGVLNKHKLHLNAQDCIIALHDDKLVGFVYIADNDMGIQRQNGQFIANLYVKPYMRCHGIGKKLIQAAIKTITHDHGKLAYLWTYTRELKDWYSKQGFVLDEEVPHYLTYKEVFIMKYQGM